MTPLRLPLPFLGLGSEAQLRALADALPHGLFTIDAAGAITFWSEGAERLTGYTRAEALGKPCSLLAGDALHGCGCGDGPVVCGLVERGKSSKVCTIRTRDGRELRILKNAVPLLGDDGTPVGALETFAEIQGVVAFPRRRHEAERAARDPVERCGLTGHHPVMRELCRMIELVARSDATVLIHGESGTGKDLVAAAVHRMGPRAAGPFVRVSCAAAEERLEDELFARAAAGPRGAVDPACRIAEAAGGTLVLDEVGDLSPRDQARLLRALEEHAFERWPDPGRDGTAVRLLCTTNRDLRRLVADGRFRADLYFRIAVFPLRVPSLRDRLEDLPDLAAAILAARAPGVALSPEVLAALAAQPWPGNVRELENALACAVLQSHGEELRPEHLPADLRPAPTPGARALAAARDERARTLAALEAAQWNRTRAAEALGISRVTLWKRMRRHGLAADGAPGASE